jgi:hypothetical protein
MSPGSSRPQLVLRTMGLQCELTGPVCTGERHLNDTELPSQCLRRPNLGNPGRAQVPGPALRPRLLTTTEVPDQLTQLVIYRASYSVVSTRMRCFETLDVLGDDESLTITTKGVLWVLRSSQGSAIFCAVGTLD